MASGVMKGGMKAVLWLRGGTAGIMDASCLSPGGVTGFSFIFFVAFGGHAATAAALWPSGDGDVDRPLQLVPCHSSLQLHVHLLSQRVAEMRVSLKAEKPGRKGNVVLNVHRKHTGY